MRQQDNAQSPGSTGESSEVVNFSIWLLACALLLHENSSHITSQEHNPLHERENACDTIAVSGSGQTQRHKLL
jgi:hypothetical protein